MLQSGTSYAISTSAVPPRAASTENLMNKKKKWIETAITWVGYSVVVIGVIILLILLRQQN